MAIDQIKKRCSELMVESDSGTSGICGNDAQAMTEEEDHDPLEQLSERHWRQIFRGLVNVP